MQISNNKGDKTMNKSKKISIITISIMFLSLIVYLIKPLNFNKIYKSENDKQIANLIENSITQIYFSKEPEFKTDVANLKIEIQVKNLKGFVYTSSYGLAEELLNSINLKWEDIKLWDKKKYDLDGNNGGGEELLLIKKDNTIIPILLCNWMYEFKESTLTKSMFDEKSKRCNDKNGATYCQLKKNKININIYPTEVVSKKSKKVTIDLID